MEPAPVDIVYRMHVVDNASEWCDTCGHRAYVFAQMPSGRSLSYCLHHGTVYWTELNRQAAIVIDLRHTVEQSEP